MAKATSDKILSAARKTFVKKGYVGAAISEIAQEAKINQSLIYHHFTNKQALWKAVKDRLLEDYEQLDEATPILNLDLRSFLTRVVTQMFRNYDQNPDFVRMMSWQRLEDSEESLAGGTQRLPDTWQGEIINLQKRGEIRPDLEPKLIVTFIASTVIGALYFPTGTLQENFTQQTKEEYVDMVIDCLERGLMPSSNSCF